MESDVFTQEQLKALNPAEHRMATQKISSLIIQYSIPTIIGMTVNALYNVVDRFWVGKIPDVGQEALTGIGICMPVMNVIMGVSQLVGIGATASISIYLGRKDRDGAEKILANSMLLILILGSIFTAFALAFSLPILRLLGADDKILPFAQPYYLIIVGLSIFGMISFTMNHPIRGMGNPKRFASTQLLGGITNMILDPIFIFGFGLGIHGAAIATVISQFLAMLWVLSYYFTNQSIVPLKRKNMPLKIDTVSTIFAIGLSPFLLQVVGSFVNIVANRSLKYHGDIALSDGNIAIGAMTIFNSISILIFMPLFGINQGVQPIIGFNHGSGALARVKQAFKWSVVYSVIICTIGLIIVQFFAPQLVLTFNNDPELVTVGSYALRTAMIFLPLVAFQIQSTNFLQSIGRAKISIFLSLLRQCIVLIPAYLIFPRILGFNGLWYALPFSDIISTLITVPIIYLELKRLDKLHSAKLEAAG